MPDGAGVSAAWRSALMLLNFYVFLCKYINASYEPNQTLWHVCLIEGWPHMELLSQPKGILTGCKTM